LHSNGIFPDSKMPEKILMIDAANDLALLKADGRFAPLPIAASRTGLLGGCWSSSFSLSGRGNTLKRELQRAFPDIGFNAKAQSRKVRKANTIYSLRPGTFASLR
jgi:hypothetical protein